MRALCLSFTGDFSLLVLENLPEWSQGVRGPKYHLSLAAYHRLVGATVDMHLAYFEGNPNDADAPLWVRRVPPGKLLRWPQPVEFVGNVVGGMTDIPVEPLVTVGSRCRLINSLRLPLDVQGDSDAQTRMGLWSLDALAVRVLYSNSFVVLIPLI